MGFGRKKMKTKTLIRIIGAFLMINAFLVLLYGANNKDFGNQLVYPLLTFGLFIIGLAMIMQRKFLVMMKNIGKDLNKGRCNCCKCTNCSRNHNHWTHDTGREL